MNSPVGSLVHWTLAIRDNPRASAIRAVLTGAASTPLVARALATPAISRRLEPLPAGRRAAALSALAVIARTPGLRHDQTVRLGTALATLPGTAVGVTLAAAAAADQASAARLLGNTLTRAASRTSANLIEYTSLLTFWDELPLRSRARFLVDYHAAGRA